VKVAVYARFRYEKGGMSHRSAVLTALLVLLATVGPVSGQDRTDVDPQSDVYLDAHGEKLNKLLADAGQAAKEGDYRKAAALYDQAADQATTQVYPVTPRTYLGIREYVKSRIRAWPPEGLAAYRSITDPRAGEIYRRGIRTGRSDLLRTVARTYPMSSLGAKAMLALGTRALARGDRETALRHLLEIFRIYPDGPIPGIRRADVIARTALAGAKRGDRLLVLEMKARAGRLPADVAVSVAGGEKRLSEVLAGMAAVGADSRIPPGWATTGGTPQRSGGRDGPIGPLTLYWAFEIPLSRADDEEKDRRNSPRLPVQPLIALGQVIAPGHLVVRALELPGPDFVPTKKSIEGLAPNVLWGFPDDPQAEPGDNSRAGLLPAFASIDGESGVLALPFRDPSDTTDWVEEGEEASKPTLLTLSLPKEGKLLDQRGGSDPLYSHLFDDLWFHGAPAIVGDRLYVAASEVPHAGARVKTLVAAFDLTGGRNRLRPMWQTSVCLGGGQSPAAFEPLVGPSSVSTRNGIVYVCSNTGAVAALDGQAGEILWIHTYEQAEQRPGLDARAVRARQPWLTNPPVLDHRFLYVAPLDADRLFVYFQMPDLETGYVEHARFGRDEVVNGFDPEYLLGVRDGVVFLAGSTRTLGERPLFAVKTGPRFFGTTDRKGDEQRILWRAEIEESAPRGRGVVAGNAIYFPTKKGIYRVDPADGSIVKLVGPADPGIQRLAGGRHVFGNLAVSGRWLVSASEELICLFGPRPDEKDEPE